MASNAILPAMLFKCSTTEEFLKVIGLFGLRAERWPHVAWGGAVHWQVANSEILADFY